jgi:hypothetical protein
MTPRLRVIPTRIAAVAGALLLASVSIAMRDAPGRSVILSEAKDLPGGNEILRFAQDDKVHAPTGFGITATRAGMLEAAPGLAEPDRAAAFVEAFRRGDEATAERVASPLYRQEWARRGLSIPDRLALLPPWRQQSRTPEPWLDFRYVGGLTDAAGFDHLLFTAVPTRSDSRPIPSVWRVDTDGAGRVIWSELVWLFSNDTPGLVPVATGRPLSAPGLPAALAAGHARLALGVRSTGGPEGYYAVLVDPVASQGGSDGHASVVAFLAVDSEGKPRPGAWSYGGVRSTMAPYGQNQTSASPAAAPDLVRLQDTYLNALSRAP